MIIDRLEIKRHEKREFEEVLKNTTFPTLLKAQKINIGDLFADSAFPVRPEDFTKRALAKCMVIYTPFIPTHSVVLEEWDAPCNIKVLVLCAEPIDYRFIIVFAELAWNPETPHILIGGYPVLIGPRGVHLWVQEVSDMGNFFADVPAPHPYAPLWEIKKIDIP